jgi:mannose-6-phosphate isomerase-like protein (cupin superfamily)
MRGYVVEPGAGIDADDPSLKASAAATGGAITVYETTIEQGPPLHVHEHEDECLYLLEGHLSIRCGTQSWDADPGSFVFLPRGEAHCFSSSQGPAKVILMAVPAGIEHYFGEIHAAVGKSALRRVGEKYGIRVVTES